MTYYLSLGVLLFVYMNLWFLISLAKKRNDVADVAWGLGFVLLAWSSFFLSGGSGHRGLLMSVLITLWGFRLAWHVYTRNRGRGEDPRYLAWRREWGRWFFLRSYAQVYLLQGALLFTIAFPILFTNKIQGPALSTLDIVGLALWLCGFCFEAVGDAQLARFIQNPSNKGRLMQDGLWAYTRHPNYFGEVTLWWGMWLIALSVPGGWFSMISPLTIMVLIIGVSGIPLLERGMADNPEFAQYKKRVNAFFPWPPRGVRSPAGSRVD